MTDRKRHELSLKRKTSFNVSVQSSKSDSDERPNKKLKADSKPGDVEQQSKQQSSKFFHVDDDLYKLRLMFVKLNRTKLDLKSLSRLPLMNQEKALQSQGNEELSEEEECPDDKDKTGLSPLPQMCSWCIRRKPQDYTHLYDNIILETEKMPPRHSTGSHGKQYFTNSTDTITAKAIDKHGLKDTNVLSHNNRALPSTDKTLLSKERIIPSNNKTLLSKDRILPSNNKTLLSNDRTLLSNNRTFPSNDKSLLSNDRTFPSNDKTFLSNNRTFPSNDKTFLSNNKTLLSNNRTFSSNDRNTTNKQNTHYSSKSADQTSYNKKQIQRTVEERQKTELSSYKPTNRTKKLFKSSSSTASCNSENNAGMEDKKSSIDNSVKNCPLCQLVFQKGATQMDIDGHIAACLSNSADDIVW